MMPIVEFRGVSKAFVGRNGGVQRVLDGVSFSIAPGCTTVIAGGSGQGKSVTLKLMLRLLQPDEGTITVDGQDINSLGSRKLAEVRTKFGVLFQGAALFDSMNVYDNVALPLRERTSLVENEIKAQVNETLEQLELLGHEEKYPAQLSGGMQKRVGLARALQLQPDIMLFDEPTTGLDPVMTDEIYRLFARTQKQVGYASIIVSHDIPKVFNLADQVIVLDNGKIDVFANPEEIQWSEKAHIREFVRTTMGEIYQSSHMEN